MLTRDDLLALDASDPLASFRSRFRLPDGVVYLDGNSLGALPAAAVEAAGTVMEEWQDRLIDGWFGEGWWDLPLSVGARIAGLIGAAPHQVVACDTVTANLFKVLHAALALRPGGDVVLRDSAFPTDRYVVESVAAGAGRRVRVVPVGEDPAAYLDAGVGVAVMEQVDFRTAEILDMEAMTTAAHETGALVIWDLSHSAGVLPVRLDEDAADFAVGCTYKYLNGGPGAPAYLYVADRHLESAVQPIPGWLGHADPFAMTDRYEPDPGIRRFLTGTQPILSMRTMTAALGAYDGVDLAAVRAKSRRMTDVFIRLVDERCAGLGLEVASPRDADRRGSQVTLRHADAAALQRRLGEAGVVVDFRTPDLLRFGFAPLYVSYADVWDAVDALRVVVGA